MGVSRDVHVQCSNIYVSSDAPLRRNVRVTFTIGSVIVYLCLSSYALMPISSYTGDAFGLIYQSMRSVNCWCACMYLNVLLWELVGYVQILSGFLRY